MTENVKFQPNKITEDSIKDVALSKYGIHLSNVKRLKGYTDKNFLVEECNSTRLFLCKVKFSDWAVIDADHINEVIRHLDKNNFNVPSSVESENGEIYTTAAIRDVNGKTINRPVQLLKFISGKSVLDMKLNEEDCLNVSWFLGYFLGSMHLCLEKCTITNGINKQSDDYVWYTENFLSINKHTHIFPNGEIKTVITEFIDQFEKRVIPTLSKLRRGYVHGDFSDSNALIASKDILSCKSCDHPNSDTERIVKKLLGAVDFEECHYGYTVFDLGVCMALMMTLAIDLNVEPINLAKIVLHGYQSHTKLSEIEKGVLYWAVASRLATSLVMSYSDKKTMWTDFNYLTGHSAKCPQLLNMLHAYGYEKVMALWFGS